MILPVNNAEVTSPYGEGYLNGKKRFHDGIDFVDAKRKDFSVFAIAPGICTYDMDNYEELLRWTDKKHSGGNMVCILHRIADRNYQIRYLHLLVNKVTIGRRVEEGQLIGLYGDVGYSFGAHLHIDAWTEDWKKVNIEQLFKDNNLL